MSWIKCPYCEGEYQLGNPHTVRDCIRETISDHRFGLTETGDFDDTAGDIIEVLQKRAVNFADQGPPGSDTGDLKCPECGNPGQWGLVLPLHYFRRCTKCGWPGK